MGRTVRKIVVIDQDKCNGCGACVPACAEGAIQIIDGKAKLVSETYCDGLGACLGECPQGAIRIEERSAEAFDEEAVRRNLGASHTSPPASPQAYAKPAAAHSGGCPGSALRVLHPTSPQPAGRTASAGAGRPGNAPPSQLGHWPVQLRLVPPGAPFLNGAHILICADCVPFAVADFHGRYLAGRAVLVGCPKLDDLDAYRLKLRQILAQAKPASLTVLRMEVPCCGGLAQAVRAARDIAAPRLPLTVHVIGIDGRIAESLLPPTTKVTKNDARPKESPGP